MRVSLGTIDIDDDTRKAIRKDMGRRGGHATRNEVKDYLLQKIDDALVAAGSGPIPAASSDESTEIEDDGED